MQFFLIAIIIIPAVGQKKYTDSLFQAIKKGDTSGIIMAVDRGANVNAKDERGMTPLQLLIFYSTKYDKYKLKNIIGYLILKGADINAMDDKGQTLLMHAASKSAYWLIRILTGNSNPNYNGILFWDRTFPHSESHTFKWADVNDLVRRQLDINRTDRNGFNAINYAVISCNETDSEDEIQNMIKNLVSAGANPDAKFPNGSTLLEYSVKEGKLKLTKALLDNGANIHTQISEFFSLLHYAVRKGKDDMVQLLLDKGADPNVKDPWGWTPLHYASKDNQLKKAYKLLESGANPNIATSDSWTPILLASYNEHPFMIKLLYFYGAELPSNVNEFNRKRYSKKEIKSPITQIDTAVSRLVNSYIFDDLDSQFWQDEVRLTFGISTIHNKLFLADFENVSINIIPSYKNSLTFNRLLTRTIAASIRLEGVTFYDDSRLGLSSNRHENSISKADAITNNQEKNPYFGFQPNLGLLLYFAPQSYSYLRIGICAGNFFGPYLIKGSYYYHHQVGIFLAPNIELRFGSWDNSLSFETSYYYSETTLDVATIDENEILPIVQRKGYLSWYDLTLRYMPLLNRNNWKISPSLSFYFSFRMISGQAIPAPRFSVAMINLGFELVWLSRSVSTLIPLIEED